MKNRILTLWVLIALLAASSCRTSGPGTPARTVAEFFNKYENRSGFKATDWSAGLTTRLLLLKLGNLGGDNELTQAISAVRSVKVLTFSPTTGSARELVAEGLTKEVDGLLANERYKPLPVTAEAGTTVMRYSAREQGDRVKEVVATGNVQGAPESFMLVAISGDFTKSQVDKLVRFLPNVSGELAK
ncbi:DUF4252 domain-containing protein [Hymenobacter metallicola]|uniref:DUF4252 domain-containing protein n=1 Tax=Hymenobacter metallicola TaxID=2563114 RepID=A0A4Z0PZY7_9BACT|nr:DUF4252 domain-containing protein [Hymenobacter metallicola]TGE22879.1 DUF4252 domain-containing protein [Hymenobacter metallicola]